MSVEVDTLPDGTVCLISDDGEGATFIHYFHFSDADTWTDADYDLEEIPGTSPYYGGSGRSFSHGAVLLDCYPWVGWVGEQYCGLDI